MSDVSGLGGTLFPHRDRELPSSEFRLATAAIFSQNTLPLDDDMLERLFGEEVRAGVVTSPLDITDAWKNSYSCSTNHKVWAAKFTARHPNLVALRNFQL
jgi:predicted nucleotide-binding protein (sugar kinase/HSP70/actin superfamily)